MFIALDSNNQHVYADAADQNAEYFCPTCGGKVRLRSGSLNAAHFAHVSSEDCDNFMHDISEWHLEWQRQFPRKNREVVIEHNDEKHRADVLVCGFVLEFQHSPISCEEFNRRNRFYTSAGKKVVWIFDMTEEFDSGKMKPYDIRNGNDLYQWKNPKRMFLNYIPQRNKNVFLFFQTQHTDFVGETEDSDVYIEQVVWAIESDSETSDFRKFCTDYNNGRPGTKTELIQCLRNKTLR